MAAHHHQTFARPPDAEQVEEGGEDDEHHLNLSGSPESSPLGSPTMSRSKKSETKDGKLRRMRESPIKIWPKPPTYREQYHLKVFIESGVVIEKKKEEQAHEEEEEGFDFSADLQSSSLLLEANKEQHQHQQHQPQQQQQHHPQLHYPHPKQRHEESVVAAPRIPERSKFELSPPSHHHHQLQHHQQHEEAEDKVEAHKRRVHKPRGPMFGNIDLRKPVPALSGLGPDLEHQTVREEATKLHKRKEYSNLVRSTSKQTANLPRAVSLSP